MIARVGVLRMLLKSPFGDLAVVTVAMMTILFIWYCTCRSTVDDDGTTPYTRPYIAAILK